MFREGGSAAAGRARLASGWSGLRRSRHSFSSRCVQWTYNGSIVMARLSFFSLALLLVLGEYGVVAAKGARDGRKEERKKDFYCAVEMAGMETAAFGRVNVT